LNWAREKISYLGKRGVKKSQLIFDVGIGFGKNAAQSIRILKNIGSFTILGLPLYVGHSKKSFLDEVNCSNFSEEKKDLNRAEKTLIISKYLAQKNVEFLRVHDVKENLKTMFENNLDPAINAG
jgi:dihydropteroate synthase